MYIYIYIYCNPKGVFIELKFFKFQKTYSNTIPD